MHAKAQSLAEADQCLCQQASADLASEKEALITLDIVFLPLTEAETGITFPTTSLHPHGNSRSRWQRLKQYQECRKVKGS